MKNLEGGKRTGGAGGSARRGSTEEVIGLTILLRKFGIKKLPAGNETDGLLVLGHYDRMILRPIRRWLDLTSNSAGDSVHKTPGSEYDANTMVTYYPIKLLFPDSESLPGGTGGVYKAWQDFDGLLKRDPCVTLVLLNLTDRYKQHVPRGTRLRALIQLFGSDAEMTRLSQATDLCLLPCIGYSDFCILMAGSSWKPAMEAVERLHALVDAQGAPILSTDYMIPAFHGTVGELEEKHLAGLTLTARVNLRPGVTAQRLHSDFGNDITVYRTSGGTDCLLRARTPEAACTLFQRLLTPGIGDAPPIDVASTLHLEESASSADLHTMTPDPDPDMAFHDLINGLYGTIDSYETALKKHRRHRRQANALREMAAIVLNVCCQLHAASLREVMEGFIRDLKWCLQQCVKEMDEQGEYWRFQEMERNVGELCAVVTEFITDLSRSDCFYMEREKYTHPAVSSSTGLLMAYNRWLNGFTKAVMQATEPGNASEYTFLVTSGGRDDTIAFDAFNFLSPEIDGQGGLLECLPIVTRMSEMSLFDFSGAILRCFHECLHFCGARYRRDRLRYMEEFAVRLFAQKLAEVLFPENSLGYLVEVYRIAWPNGAEEAGFQSAAEQIYQRCFEAVRDAAARALLDFFPEQELDREEQLYAKLVEEWMFDRFQEAFSGALLHFPRENEPPEFSTGVLDNQIFEAVQQAYIEFYREGNALIEQYEARQRAERRAIEALGESDKLNDFKRKEGRTAILGFEWGKQEVLARYDGDPYIWKAISLSFSRLLAGAPPYSYPANELESKEARRWMVRFPFVDLTRANVDYVLSMMQDVFTETFSDLISCRILGARLVDYLLAQVYEDWNPDDSLPQDDPVLFRISAVLRLLFPEDLEADATRLRQEAKAEIGAAVRRLEAHGMRKNRIDPLALCTRVDALLSDFAECLWIGEPLLDYLQLCLNNYGKAGVWEKLRAYQSDFQKLRLLSIEPDAADTHSRIIAMYQALTTGGEDRNEQ